MAFTNSRPYTGNPVPSGSAVVPSIAPAVDPAQAIGRMVEGYITARQKQAVIDDGLHSVQQETQYKVELQDWMGQNDPTSDDFGKQFEEKASSLMTDKLQGFKTQEGAADAQKRMVVYAGATLMKAHDDARAITEDRAVTAWSDSANETLASVRQDPDNTNAYLADFTGRADRLAVGLSPDVREKMNRKFQDQVVNAHADGLIEAGRFDEADKFIDSGAAAGINPEDVRRLKRANETARNQAAEEMWKSKSDAVATLFDKADQGSLSFAEVDRLDGKGFFDGHEMTRTTLRDRIRAKQHQDMVDAERRASNAQQLAALKGLNPYKSGDPDKMYEHDLETAGVDWTNPVGMVKVAGRYLANGIVPGQVTKYFNFADKSSEPGALEQAMQLRDSVTKTNPNIEIDNTPRLDAYTSLRVQGFSSDEATARVQQLGGTAQERKLRTEAWPQQASDARFDYKASRADVAKAIDAGEDQVDSADVQRYNNMVKGYVVDGMNLDTARLTAQGRMKRNVSINRVGDPFGRGVSQMYAPVQELMKRVPLARQMGEDKVTTLVSNYMRKRLSDDGVSPSVMPGDAAGSEWSDSEQYGLPPFQMVTDDQTRREAAAGRPPTYPVRIRTSAGMTRLLHADGSEFRYELPLGQEAFDDLVAATPSEKQRIDRDRVESRKDTAAAQVDALTKVRRQQEIEAGQVVPGKGRSQRPRQMTAQELKKRSVVTSEISKARGKLDAATTDEEKLNAPR